MTRKESDMDRISDEWLAAEIRYLEGCNSENYSTYISALVELRERRKADKQAEIDYYSNETHT